MIPKPMMQHYISLLLKHRRLILSGPSGTGKTYLAQRLARYLLARNRTDSSEADNESCIQGRTSTVTFNMHHQSQKVIMAGSDFFFYISTPAVRQCQMYPPSLRCQELQLYLSDVANQIDREGGVELPLVVIIDDISDSAAISELVNGALTCKYHKW